MTCFPHLAVLCLGLACLLPAAAHQPRELTADMLGVPKGDWPFVRRTANGDVTYQIPSQLGAIRRLPEPERSASLRTIREHQGNLDALRRTTETFRPLANKDRLHAEPEYRNDLSEAVMSIDGELAAAANPILQHEPVLLALPPYTKIILLTPRAALAKVRDRLAAIGMAERVRLVVSRPATAAEGNGTTRWIRDAILVTNADRRVAVVTPLAYKKVSDVAHNDLDYISRVRDRRHTVVRIPLYFRGGNLARVDHGKKYLLIGDDELAMNRQWFIESFGFTPLPAAVPAILRGATGVDEVVVLPNSRNLYHLDMYLTPLAAGKVGLLAPIDPERLGDADRKVLLRAREILVRLGIQTLPIPTRVERIEKSQSPTNSVSFTERGTGRRRALVPQFPEPANTTPANSLNAHALAAYRQAGIDPIPVEDRFHTHSGNTHCALVALR